MVKFKGKKIHVKDVSPSNNGVYRCVAHNDAGTAESFKNFILKTSGVLYPQIKIPPKDVLVKKGSNVMFDCLFDDSVKTKWLFNNEELEKNDSKR